MPIILRASLHTWPCKHQCQFRHPIGRLTADSSLFGRPFRGSTVSLLSATLAATAISRWTTNALYDDGRAKAQEARVARMAGSPILDKLIALWTLPLPSKARAIVAKDVKTFVRDPSQWTQLFLVGSIVIIAIVSVANLPVDSFRGPWMQTWLNGLSFLILALVGFVMAALAARFQFAAVSNEGRGFWVMRTGPIGAKEFLWAKAYPGFANDNGRRNASRILNHHSRCRIRHAVGWYRYRCTFFWTLGIAVGMERFTPTLKQTTPPN